MNNFFVNNEIVLKNFVKLSTIPGARPDYVQGGGGNTSCKFEGGLMAIKASGFKLSQICEDNGYAVLDYMKIAEFYNNNDPANIDDVEAAGSVIAKNAVVKIDGLPELRPSVEAGFHSLLDKYVLHTHPVYANMVTCAAEGREVIDKVLGNYEHSYGYIPYINPGASLTFAISAEIDRVKNLTGKRPAVIFMQNHGLIATHNDYEVCMSIHAEVNTLFATEFGVLESDYPNTNIKKCVDGDANLQFVSESEWTREIAKNTKYDMAYFCELSLYPDQMVFLNGNIAISGDSMPEDFALRNLNKCSVYRGSGDVVYTCGFDEAKTIEETIIAVTFITSSIEKKGLTVVPMNSEGKDFIAGWESEKYRKSMVGK